MINNSAINYKDYYKFNNIQKYFWGIANIIITKKWTLNIRALNYNK